MNIKYWKGSKPDWARDKYEFMARTRQRKIEAQGEEQVLAEEAKREAQRQKFNGGSSWEPPRKRAKAVIPPR